MVVHQAFDQRVESAEELREILGEPSERAVRKQLDRLDPHCRAFIARSPFALVGTSSADGIQDVSPRGDAVGFILVLDDRRLVIPERPGNRRADTLGNILENPRVGLLFLIPGVEETLRVNGDACIVRDPELLERTAARGKRPDVLIGVTVCEAFLHCAKAFKRSQLWDPARHLDRNELPSLGQMLVDQLRLTDTTVDEVDRSIEEGYATRLY
jgi:PPOX class probable FMN-dependent enzyme